MNTDNGLDPVDGTAGIPRDIVEAMNDQMRTVLSIQASRATACAQSGRRAAETVTGQETAELTQMRAEYRAERSYWNEGGPVMARTDDRTIHTAGVDVPIRIHRPTKAALLPGIIFVHGGGFILGDLDTHDRIQRVLAAESGAAVIGVDYSLSPEASYPQALHETAGIVDHIARHGADFGLAGNRVGLGGDSAGAMLTMGAALLLRDHPASIGVSPESFSALKALLLFYGGHGLKDSASRRLYGGAWDGMSAEDLAAINTVYFSSPTQANDDYVNHLGADLAGLPPTFIASAGLDPLLDDSRALARLLKRSGNLGEYQEYPGVLHSFLHFGRALDEATNVLTTSAAFAARFF